MIIGITEPVTRLNESLACAYAILESNWTKHVRDESAKEDIFPSQKNARSPRLLKPSSSPKRHADASHDQALYAISEQEHAELTMLHVSGEYLASRQAK